MELLRQIIRKQVSIEITELTEASIEHASAERGEADGTDRAATNGTVRAASNGGQANVGFESELQGAAQETPAVLQVETLEQEAQETQKNIPVPKARKEGWMDNVIDNSCRENSWFGKKCLLIFKVYLRTH